MARASDLGLWASTEFAHFSHVPDQAAPDARAQLRERVRQRAEEQSARAEAQPAPTSSTASLHESGILQIWRTRPTNSCPPAQSHIMDASPLSLSAATHAAASGSIATAFC